MKQAEKRLRRTKAEISVVRTPKTAAPPQAMGQSIRGQLQARSPQALSTHFDPMA